MLAPSGFRKNLISCQQTKPTSILHRHWVVPSYLYLSIERTSIWPSRSRVSKRGCGNVAGPSTTLPSRTSNREPCHGHWTTLPSNLPSDNGPPKCEHVWAS